MAAYIRELLIDSIYRPHQDVSDDAIDFNMGLKRLLQIGVIRPRHITVLRSYMSGYSLSELLLTHADAKELLIEVLSLLEYETHRLDEIIIQTGLRKYPKYTKIADALRRQITYYGRAFDSIDAPLGG